MYLYPMLPNRVDSVASFLDTLPLFSRSKSHITSQAVGKHSNPVLERIERFNLDIKLNINAHCVLFTEAHHLPRPISGVVLRVCAFKLVGHA